MVDKPSLEDLGCPICLEILTEPVRLCCGHYLCKVCLDGQFEKSDFRCPLCKVRLSSWARRVKGGFVDKEKWKLIQTLYPKEVESKLNGESSDLFINSCRKISEKGEVEAEYKIKKAKFEEERSKEKAEQDSASEKFIEAMLENERLASIQLQKDEEFAKNLDSQLNTNTNLSNSFLEKKDKSKKGSVDSKIPKSASINKYLKPSPKKDFFKYPKSHKNSEKSFKDESIFAKFNLSQNVSEEIINSLLEKEKLVNDQLKKDEEFAKILDSQLNFPNNLNNSFTETNSQNELSPVIFSSPKNASINKYLKPSPSKDLLKGITSKKIQKQPNSKQKFFGIEKFFSKKN